MSVASPNLSSSSLPITSSTRTSFLKDEFRADNGSLPSLNTLIEGLPKDEEGPGSPLWRRDSSAALFLVEDTASSFSSISISQQSTVTFCLAKRDALNKLLSSERAYASDLALVKDVYIPLALGHPGSDTNASQSSTASTSVLSFASDSSIESLVSPMSAEDVKIIFSNIAELALFSHTFCDNLQTAFGTTLDGGSGFDDSVGALFERMMPDITHLFERYIIRYSSAAIRLKSLPKTPALEAYFAQAQAYTRSFDHARDLYSVLLLPVQRLFMYSLLLGAIVYQTPDSHPDKEHLLFAKRGIEKLAHTIHEERRRREVVQKVLMRAPRKILTSNLLLASLGKQKALSAAKTYKEAEAAKVDRLEDELKKIEQFAYELAKEVLGWSKAMTVVVQKLRIWARSFGQVIGLSEEQGSEAFNAFTSLLDQFFAPSCLEMESMINERLLKEIASLLATMQHPMKLIESMNEQEPFHYHLLTMNVTPNNRPPLALLEASSNYLALRDQLSKELPRYLELLHRGIALSLRRLANIQTRFWQDVRDRWGELWETLRVDGEMNAGAQETIGIWRTRWLDADEVVKSLVITNNRRIYQEPPRPIPSMSHSAVPTLPLPRAKSMPLTASPSMTISTSAASSSSSKTPVIDLSPLDDSFFTIGEDERKPSLRKKLSDSIRSTSRPQSRRPGSSKGLSTRAGIPPLSSSEEMFSIQMYLRKDSWPVAKAKYACRVIHPCRPPAVVSYFSFPFFTLVEGDVYQILQEAGHPSTHPKLPLYVDQGEDCLLLCRNEMGAVGWALACFLEPIFPS
ncbi:hypothetical protein GYMLUDRAFT_50250 [Collybiopsis luxurians FD-317 M1]|uniref:DH domain-containing protein n=1 Tax=Collybiopsis luxurians FD-317 M1 TaxID=944289 RepID=A0A0D0CAU8_9AGAR|nr:hypothetical protein GYMLUDRAFT_50250 [Collybiopsis luxurians FD-317 M1]